MLKKMLVVLAVLLMANTVFGAWSANKFKTFDPNNIDSISANLPTQTYQHRTVDWEGDGNHVQRKGESWNWPAQYMFVPITDVKVQMDVGFWIKINDCSTNKIIKLKQRMINQYGGSVSCTAYTNVATQWAAAFVKADKLPDGSTLNMGGYKHEARVDPSSFAAKPGGQSISIQLKLWDVDLANLPAGTNCLDIGIVRVFVRPSVMPNNFMSGCGGSYPQYSPPPTDSNITWW